MSRPERDVLLCRDCCCGSSTKHPDVDHHRQRERLLEAVRGCGARVRVVRCLDECDRSNVVMVRDLTAARRGRDTWVGDVLDDDATEALADWIATGGAVPDALASHVFRRRGPRP